MPIRIPCIRPVLLAAALCAVVPALAPADVMAGMRNSVEARQGRWMRYQSAHVVLLAPGGLEIADVLRELERAYLDVRAYGITMPRQVQARCYGAVAAFVQGSGGSSWNLALAVDRTIHLQPPHVLARQGAMGRALRHEMVHVGLAGAARRGLPRWMNEGLAMVVAAEKHQEQLTFRTLAGLEDTLARSRDYKNVRSAYATAERLVSALVAAHGRARVLSMVGSVGGGVRFERAFESLTGLPPGKWAQGRLR